MNCSKEKKNVRLNERKKIAKQKNGKNFVFRYYLNRKYVTRYKTKNNNHITSEQQRNVYARSHRDEQHTHTKKWFLQISADSYSMFFNVAF